MNIIEVIKKIKRGNRIWRPEIGHILRIRRNKFESFFKYVIFPSNKEGAWERYELDKNDILADTWEIYNLSKPEK